MKNVGVFVEIDHSDGFAFFFRRSKIIILDLYDGSASMKPPQLFFNL